jgi:hypothetical protein
MVVLRSYVGLTYFKRVGLCVLAIASLTLPMHAQRGGGSSGGGTGGTRGPSGSGGSTRPPVIQPGNDPNIDPGMIYFPTPEPMPKPVVVEDESCLPWDLPDVRGATVSAMRLGVPPKARGQYEKACGAYKKQKWTDAEQHAREAIQSYSKYLAAWVMLGEVLQDQQKMDEAHDACSKAITLDPTYLPPYLCLAGLLNRQNEWSDLIALSDRFLGMNLVGDRYAYYYRGLAHFHLQNWQVAQQNVLHAISIDTEHHQPNLYFLLAQIYGEQGDVADAKIQIRQFLKFNIDREDKNAAKQYLAKLDSQQTAK